MRANIDAAEAIVLSCTDMRSVEIISRLEAYVGKPVITSNQAMAYEALRLMGIDDPVEGFGQLLTLARVAHISETELA